MGFLMKINESYIKCSKYFFKCFFVVKILKIYMGLKKNSSESGILGIRGV